MAEPPHPFGLALSGGGFRATAFHLGVLKRLRELGLLHKVDIISTVSGGSIAGAYWVYYQAKKGDTLNDDEEWNRFERSLVRFMRHGVRAHAVIRGLFAPWLVFASASLLGLRLIGPPPLYQWVVTFVVTFMAAYFYWHYRASAILATEYNRRLFNNCTLRDLAYSVDEAGTGRKWPRLIVCSTALNSGIQVIFTNDHLVKGPPSWPKSGSLVGSFQRYFVAQRLAKDGIPLPMSIDNRLADAVAASSCFPLVFAPLKLQCDDAVASHVAAYRRGPPGNPAFLWLVDGGVFDNQGTYSLISAKCTATIVSDASAALRPIKRPSTWQVWPLGRGVIFRSYDVLYERIRNWGFKYIEDHYMLSRPPRQPNEPISRDRDWSRLELWPDERDPPRLTDELIYCISRIRTDLDRFSAAEVSALMFHGDVPVIVEI